MSTSLGADLAKRLTWEFLDFDSFEKANPCHDAKGRFCETGGGARGGRLKVTAVKGRVFTGEPVPVKSKPSKLEVGALGEDLVASYLHKNGKTDVRPMNVRVNNAPVDLMQNHGAIEVKAGLVSNGKTAQHWRATIGQPGKKEAAWLRKANKGEKRAWLEYKKKQIIKRKEKAVAELSKKMGRKVKGSTYALIINPDTKRADLYHFKGFHSRIPWNSKQAARGYVATLAYE